MQSADQTFPFLAHFIETIKKAPFSPPHSIESFSSDSQSETAAAKLKMLFDKYGSDKARAHDYHHLYGYLLRDNRSVSHLLEIGLGTNDPTVVSNMGRHGSPGASLRAFRDFLPNAEIYGADIDRSILFEESRIRTFYADQTNLDSLERLSNEIGSAFDLIIDDGLHAPHANLACLTFAAKNLKPGGS